MVQHMDFGRRALVAWVVLAMLGWSPGWAAEPVTTRFKETDELFANPHKGWMPHQRLPSREPRLPCSVTYFRLNWMDLEPAEGQREWKLIDDAIAAWSKRGVRIAFRIMTTNAHSSGYYCSPKWLFDAGCKFHEYERGGGDPTSGGTAIKRIEPDYADPIYLEKHRALILALGARYDGHPGVEFLDIGSYGIWGEWHTANARPWEVRKQILDMYFDAFKKTPLMCMSDDAEALAYTISRGAGFRRDGVGSVWHEQNWIGSKKYARVEGFAENWKKAPVVFEWFGNYEYLMSRDWPFDKAVQFMLDNHVTYVQDNIGRVPAEQWPQIEKLARLSGYRFVLREVSYSPAVARGEELAVRMKWSNVGVGKLYRRYELALCLLDGEGKAVAMARQDKVDVTAWLPGDHAAAGVLKVGADVKPGEYELAVGLVDGASGKAVIRLAIDAPRTDGMYHLGRVSVE